MNLKDILEKEVRDLNDRKLNFYESQKGDRLKGLANIAAIHEMVNSYQRVINNLEKENADYR
jgi:hypothetical protein